MKFMTETLVTDIRCWEVVKQTAKTITIRQMRKGEEVYNDGAELPVVGHIAIPHPEGYTMTLRLRKDGTYRTGNGMRPLRETENPIFYTDYKF
jgi:hypothetical protein